MRNIFRLFISIFLFFLLEFNSLAQNNILITQDNSPYYIMEDLIIEEGGSFTVTEGAEIFLADSVFILSHGEISIIGSKEKPIKIRPINQATGWDKIEVTQAAEKVIIEHTIIEEGVLHISDCDVEYNHVSFINNQSSVWNRAISRFFRGSLVIQNSSINSNNRGEGFLCHDINNIILSNNVFTSIPDAVEYIRCTNGKIRANKFFDITDDAIDLNNCSNIIIDSNFILNVGDRGMEIGSEGFGNSTDISVLKNVIINCKEGINFKEESTGLIENNTLFNNAVGINIINGQTRTNGSHVIIRNCILSQNTTHVYTDDLSTATSSYCLTNDVLLDGENNIVGEPDFTNVDLQDFSLLETSECIDAGDPQSPSDPDGTRVDIGALYHSSVGVSVIPHKENKIWPCPSSGIINLELPQNNTYRSFYLIGIFNKQEIFPSHVENNRCQFDISEHKSGIYYMLCSGKNAQTSFKIIKL